MIGYNKNFLQHTACLFVNQIMVDNFASVLIARKRAGPQTKWRFPPHSVSDAQRLTINVCDRAHRGPAYGFSCALASDRN